MIKIIFNGICGKMGKMVNELVNNSSEYEIVAGIDKSTTSEFSFPVFDSIDKCDINADVLIDFSRPDAITSLLNFCKKQNMPIVVCSTGFSDEQLKELDDASKNISVFRSANMSFGINLIKNVLESISSKLFNDYDIEIIEKHHNQKVDAPSGTAILLGDAIKNSLNDDCNFVFGRDGISKREQGDIGFHAVRGGTIVGEHEVIFAGTSEIISIKHMAESREVFAKGALIASKFIASKKSGKYNMDDIIKN